MNRISIAQAFNQWKDGGGMGSPFDIHGRHDAPALAESWNNYTDSLAKDRELCALQYHYAPAYDEDMPGEGTRFNPLADDREFILTAMAITLDAVFVPFSQSRSKGEKQPSLNWRVTLKKDGREVIATDYMQGCAHCPAYSSPTMFKSGKLDEYTTKKRIAAECETGRATSSGDHCTSTFSNNGAKIKPPSVVDVLHSLLQDGRAIDSRDFADWCADYGYDTDSRKAEENYRACLGIGLKLRGTFGDKTMRELYELFEDM
ncbi:MAG: hypothetical protein ACK5PF_08230 [bacterium]